MSTITRVTIRERNEMRRLRSEGASFGRLANLFCIDPQLVDYHCQGIKGVGAKSGRPRKFDYAKAASLRAQGLTLKAIGERFGVDGTTVRRALRVSLRSSKTGGE